MGDIHLQISKNAANVGAVFMKGNVKGNALHEGS